MYDCGFGDCFCLQEEYVERPLFIDFGIHSHSKVGYKCGIYDNVLNDMHGMSSAGGTGMDFLLTHYHSDHFSGLMYLLRQRKKQHHLQHIRFENVYIPNVWNITDSKNIVMQLLLSYLPSGRGRKMNIMDFLTAICKTNGKVHLVSRGDMIGDELVALWPPSNMSAKNMREVSDIADEGFWVLLGEIAEKLIDVVLTLIVNAQDGEYAAALAELRGLKTRFSALFGRLPQIGEDARIKLNELGNEISIVFHNIQEAPNRRNILFAGDVHPQAWRCIASPCRNDYPLHKAYGIIKVPHHGTASYYYDFIPHSTHSPETVYMIPNGDIKMSGYEICAQYPRRLHGAAVRCANNTACEEKNCAGYCTCIPGHRVSPASSHTF